MNPPDKPAANDEGAAAALTEIRQILLGDSQRSAAAAHAELEQRLLHGLDEQAGRIAALERRCEALEAALQASDARLEELGERLGADLAQLASQKADRQALSGVLQALAGAMSEPDAQTQPEAPADRAR